MAEYIDKEIVLSLVQPDTPEDDKAAVTIATAKKLVRSIVYRTPTADVAPVVHGRWIEKEKYTFGIMYYCSLCENRILDTGNPWHYCPNCGAKMDEPVGNSDRLEEDK